MPKAKPHRRNATRIAALVIAIVAGVLACTFLGANAFVRIAYGPFYEAAIKEFPIPGLGQGFVPQDLDYLDGADAWLFSGYSANGGPSPLYRRDADGSVARLTVTLPDGTTYEGHGSAVTSTERYVLLAREGGLLALDAQEVSAAADGGSVAAIGERDLGFSPAFMNIEEGQLYAGEFFFPKDYETPAHHRITTPDGTENPAIMYAYAADEEAPFGFAELPERAYSIPAKVQGVAVTSSGQMVLSCSYGLAASELMAFDLSRTTPDGSFDVDGAAVPLYALDSRSRASVLEAPPMTEGIESHESRVYVSEESASGKYHFGKLYGAGWVYSVEL